MLGIREINLLGNARELRFHAELKASASYVALDIVFAVLGLLSVLFLWPVATSTPDGWLALVASTAMAFGCALSALYWGIFLKVYDFSPSHVSCRARSIFGGIREWQEPLSAFRGVLYKTEVLHGGKSVAKYHEIVLVHGKVNSRDITLYKSADDAGLSTRHELCCRVFGLPKLTRKGGAEILSDFLGMGKSKPVLGADGHAGAVTESHLPGPVAQDADESIRQMVADGELIVDTEDGRTARTAHDTDKPAS